MFKIAVVDDEPKIRNGIVFMLSDIFAQEAEIVGYSGAKEFLQSSSKIDILITDICMPEIDGIAMGNIIKERYPDSKIIIISGYEDFEFARRAIQLQVTEYLLKPVDREKLEKILRTLLNDLKRENQYPNQEEALKEKRKSLLYRIMTQNNLESKELLKKHHQKEKLYYICVLECGIGPNVSIEFDFEEWAFEQMKMICNDYQVINILDTRMGIILYQSIYPERGELNRMMDEMEIRNQNLSIGISNVSMDIDQLNEQYEQAYIASKQELYTGKNGIYFYQTTNKVELDLEKLVLKMLNSLVNSNAEVFLSLFRKLFDNIKKNKPSIFELKAILDKIIGDIKYLLEKVDVVSKKYDEMERKIILVDQYRSIKEIEDDLFDFLRIILEEVNQIKTLRVKQSLQSSIDYINQNYRNDISLDEVSEKAHLNPSYFSSYFKKHTGYNFVDYITKKRIEEAKKYLQNEEYKIADISSLVGFKEARYFAKIFKNNVGVTPSQYREITKKMK